LATRCAISETATLDWLSLDSAAQQAHPLVELPGQCQQQKSRLLNFDSARAKASAVASY
jgi:protein subunit release factor B